MNIKKEIKVAIHQPNYMPWIGFFNKMKSADVFIFFDTVQYSRRSYQNRVHIKTPKGIQWLTQPVNVSGSYNILTKDVTFAVSDWSQKHFLTLQRNYKRSRYWDEYEPELHNLLINDQSEYLSETNIKIIQWIAKKLNICVEYYIASDLEVIEEEPSMRLIKLVKKVGGSVYKHGEGGKKYQNRKLFAENNIVLEQAEFKHPIYKQLWGKEFEKGLSIIDLLFNEGPRAADYLQMKP